MQDAEAAARSARANRSLQSRPDIVGDPVDRAGKAQEAAVRWAEGRHCSRGHPQDLSIAAQGACDDLAGDPAIRRMRDLGPAEARDHLARWAGERRLLRAHAGGPSLGIGDDDHGRAWLRPDATACAKVSTFRRSAGSVRPSHIRSNSACSAMAEVQPAAS